MKFIDVVAGIEDVTDGGKTVRRFTGIRKL